MGWKAKGLLFAGLAVMLGLPFAGAESVKIQVLNSSSSHQIVECEPGSIPETSIIDKTRKDIARVLDPGYRKRYPGECSVWTKNYVIDNGQETTTYQLEIMKYLGDGWEALISVERDDKGVGYANVDMEKMDVGATNPHGHLKTRLPEGNFTVSVDTADGQLMLEGETR